MCIPNCFWGVAFIFSPELLDSKLAELSFPSLLLFRRFFLLDFLDDDVFKGSGDWLTGGAGVLDAWSKITGVTTGTIGTGLGVVVLERDWDDCSKPDDLDPPNEDPKPDVLKLPEFSKSFLESRRSGNPVLLMLDPDDAIRGDTFWSCCLAPEKPEEGIGLMGADWAGGLLKLLLFWWVESCSLLVLISLFDKSNEFNVNGANWSRTDEGL